MTKIFDLPYLRHYLKPLSTTDELVRLKQYFSYQKNLAKYLINSQRLLISKLNRQTRRFNYRLYTDKKLFENFGFSPIRSNPNVFIINEKRFNRLSITDQNHINKRPLNTQLESKTSINSIDHIKTEIKTINIPILKLNTCSTLIATGHGIAEIIPSLIKTDIEQVNDEDISLSKTCKNIFNRSLFQQDII